MRLPRFGRNRSVQFNVTPLIDVVFLLIIFFLVSSHLAQQETQVELTLPAARSVLESPELSIPRVTINVRSDGQLMLGSETVDAQEVGRRLGVERQETADDLEVRIRADHQLAYRHIEPLLLACAEAGIWNVSFAVTEKERK
jgi:biopolymer transport protein ExbD